MTFPCCGCHLKIGCRIFGTIDIFLSIISLFQWLNLCMEATLLKGDDWDSFLRHWSDQKKHSSMDLKCGHEYLDLYVPDDLGTQLMKVAVFYSLSSLGYLITGLFLIYATISAPDAGKVLLAVFIFCQLILMSISIIAATLFQDPVLCYYQNDGIPGHQNRQVAFLALTLVFVFGYKLYELLLIGLYMRQLGRVVPYPDPDGIYKMSPAGIRALQLTTPKQSKTDVNKPDLNMNFEPKSDLPMITVTYVNPQDVVPYVVVDVSNQEKPTPMANVVIDDKRNGNSLELDTAFGSQGFYSPNICQTEG